MVQTDRVAPVLLIVGPTACGKSALGMELAEMLQTDIISCDSMQIYRGMDIGTAKPTREEQQRVRHHLIDIVNIDEEFSAGNYVSCAEAVVAEVNRKNKTPLFVGGTGLYANSFLFSYEFGGANKSDAVRRELTAYYEREGVDALYEKLLRLDPESAANIHKNNIKRVIRALEIFSVSGRKKSDSKFMPVAKRAYLAVGVTRDRSKLYSTIDARVDGMLRAGFVEEVRDILQRGYSRSLQSMGGIGYREIAAYLDGECSYQAAVDAVKQNTRRYAKRQLTWFKKMPAITWLDLDLEKHAAKTVYETYRKLL